MAVGHMIRGRGRGRARGIDVGSVAVAGDCVVVQPLVGRVEVSKRVHATIQAVVVVAAAVRGIRVGWAVVVGAVWICVGWGAVYPRTGSSNAHADTNAVSIAHAVGDGTGRIGAVWLLACVGEVAALAVAGRVDVLMARLGKGFHIVGARAMRKRQGVVVI